MLRCYCVEEEPHFCYIDPACVLRGVVNDETHMVVCLCQVTGESTTIGSSPCAVWDLLEHHVLLCYPVKPSGHACLQHLHACVHAMSMALRFATAVFVRDGPSWERRSISAKR